MIGLTDLLVRLFVKNSENVGNTAVRASYGKLGGLTGIACNLLLFAIKLTAGLLSGSFSVVADAFNNLSDLGSSLITLFGFKMAEKPADKDHPFGHGRMEYISALIVSCAIVVVGIELLKGSVEKIAEPAAPSVSVLTVAILTMSILIRLWMFIFNRKLGKRIDSDALIAAASDSLNDCISTGAVLVSMLILRFTGFDSDAYVGLAVSLFIIFSGLKSVKDTIDPLLGTPAKKSDIRKIADIALSYDEFIGTHDIIIHNYGPGRVFCTLHVEVPQTADIVTCHEQADRCEKEIYDRLGMSAVIHTDPVAVGDPLTEEVKSCLESVLSEIGGNIKFHDFRVVNGKERINVIFDIVVHPGDKLSEQALCTLISAKMRDRDRRYCCVITVDDDYTSEED